MKFLVSCEGKGCLPVLGLESSRNSVHWVACELLVRKRILEILVQGMQTFSNIISVVIMAKIEKY